MPFHSPLQVSDLEHQLPDSITVADFMLRHDAKYTDTDAETDNDTDTDDAKPLHKNIPRRQPLKDSRPPFTCGLTGKEYAATEVRRRVDFLTRGLAAELGWSADESSEWSKAVAIYSVNTIDTLTLTWATHRLGGLLTPVNPSYSAPELEFQLKDAGAKCLVTCAPLLKNALAACAKVGIPEKRIFILDTPQALAGGRLNNGRFKSVDDLIEAGSAMPSVQPIRFKKGEGAERVAFLCYSSGTSGLPKGVMITHKNVIANMIQVMHTESEHRNLRSREKAEPFTQTVLGLLPMSHIYSLVVICHISVYRGDQVIVLPNFEMKSFLDSIRRFRINVLILVPPIIVAMIKNKKILDKFDLSSVENVFSGAAPLAKETTERMQELWPQWMIRQGYGLTETSPVVSSTYPDDIWHGSCGSIIPGIEARLLRMDGTEIEGYDETGELVVKSPSVARGYLNDDKANKETFRNGYLYTGDEATFRKAPSGREHLFITDRIKELIKVKGFQVAPAELEACILTHPSVSDCAVIPVPDDAAGEVPKVFVVKQPIAIEESDRLLARQIMKHVEKDKARHKWLKGGVEFIDVIPKSPSGKILRRILRDKEKEARRQKGAKI